MNNIINTIKGINPIYGAALVLLVGQAFLGLPERKEAQSFNTCVATETENGLAANGSNRLYQQKWAVAYCNGRRP